MTEDMRERFEKWHVDKFGYVPIWNESRQQYAGRSREMAEIWQAALSSAGTSGTADSEGIEVWAVFNSGFFQGVFSTRDDADEYACIMFPDSPELEIKQMLLSSAKRGDSLSGKEEAAAPPREGG